MNAQRRHAKYLRRSYFNMEMFKYLNTMDLSKRHGRWRNIGKCVRLCTVRKYKDRIKEEIADYEIK